MFKCTIFRNLVFSYAPFIYVSYKALTNPSWSQGHRQTSSKSELTISLVPQVQLNVWSYSSHNTTKVISFSICILLTQPEITRAWLTGVAILFPCYVLKRLIIEILAGNKFYLLLLDIWQTEQCDTHFYNNNSSSIPHANHMGAGGGWSPSQLPLGGRSSRFTEATVKMKPKI